MGWADTAGNGSVTEELLQLWPAAGISHPNLPRAISPQPQPGWKRAELHLGTQEGSVGKGGAPCQPQMGRQKEKGLPEPCMETEHKKKKYQTVMNKIL